jgi:hypothetical protein
MLLSEKVNLKKCHGIYQINFFYLEKPIKLVHSARKVFIAYYIRRIKYNILNNMWLILNKISNVGLVKNIYTLKLLKIFWDRDNEVIYIVVWGLLIYGLIFLQKKIF